MTCTPLDPAHSVAKYFVDCENAAVRTSKLIQQLLIFARGGDPVKKLIDLADLIRETVPFRIARLEGKETAARLLEINPVPTTVIMVSSLPALRRINAFAKAGELEKLIPCWG